MGNPAAKEGDRIVGNLDVHMELVSGYPVPIPHSFSGPITKQLSGTVYIDNKRAAVLGSGADNSPGHIAQSGQFVNNPENTGTIVDASNVTFANGERLARDGDPATTCNDMGSERMSQVVASGTVFSG